MWKHLLLVLFILIACFLPVKHMNYDRSGNSTDAKHLVSVQVRMSSTCPQGRFSCRDGKQWQSLLCSYSYFTVFAILMMALWLIITTWCPLLASLKEHPLHSFSGLTDIDLYAIQELSPFAKCGWSSPGHSPGIWEAGELAKWFHGSWYQQAVLKWCMQTWNGASNCSLLLKQLKIIWQIWSTSDTAVLWGRRQLYVWKSCHFYYHFICCWKCHFPWHFVLKQRFSPRSSESRLNAAPIQGSPVWGYQQAEMTPSSTHSSAPCACVPVPPDGQRLCLWAAVNATNLFTKPTVLCLFNSQILL